MANLNIESNRAALLTRPAWPPLATTDLPAPPRTQAPPPLLPLRHNCAARRRRRCYELWPNMLPAIWGVAWNSGSHFLSAPRCVASYLYMSMLRWAHVCATVDRRRCYKGQAAMLPLEDGDATSGRPVCYQRQIEMLPAAGSCSTNDIRGCYDGLISLLPLVDKDVT